MAFEEIEKLKRELTDKYVIVDENQPELRRFVGLTGTVKTVNMNGRALVEFDGRNNRAWFDIDPSFLKMIDEPLPKPEEKAPPKAAKKTPAKKPAAKKPAADKAPAKETAAEKPVAEEKPVEKPAAKETPTEKPVAAKDESPPPAASDSGDK